VFLEFSLPTSGKTESDPKNLRRKNMLEVLHHAKFGGTWISPAVQATKNTKFLTKNIKFFVCLSVCLYVTVLNIKIVRTISS